jgi:uncharacterized protein (TIGR01777 family)
MKIIITAANGFMGEALVNYFSKTHKVVAIVRKSMTFKNAKTCIWDGKNLGDWANELDGADVLINLAGKSVNCRYNEANKAAIYTSRLESTTILGKAIEGCENPPKLWINAASATIYRHSLNDPMTESTGEIGTGFSVDVCQKWEKSFFDFQLKKTRQVALRTAIVLGKNGGVMIPFKRLSQLGFGGNMGDGQQQFSWIHIEDVCRSIEFIIENESLNGAINVSSPNPVRNKDFMQALRHRYNRFAVIPSPVWLLEMGAKLIKTETELILKSRFVLPEKLEQAGFQWKLPKIEDALKEC